MTLAFTTLLQAQGTDFEQPPIDYTGAATTDAVWQLDQRLSAGEAELDYEDNFGYLRSALSALEVPIASQTLVFSKTSLQLHRISPRRPRALYFNDDVYVGYCQNGDVLEFAVTDPKQGAIFYTLAQDADQQPKFVRDRGQCLACHANTRTQNVPGYLVRSVFPDASGRPKLSSGTFVTDQTSPFHERWGGWYVTGKHGSMRHMGNTIATDDETTFDRDPGANVIDLNDRFSTDNYLTPHSDLVALMVLEHQTQMHNAIAAANYETRRALHQSYQMNELLDRPKGHISDSANRRIDSSVDRVLEHLLMCDEFPLTDPVSGTSDFAKEFEDRGPRDSQGRSLRQLDLTTRLFRYPCSYLIYSDAFAALPPECRSRVMAKLDQILSGQDAPDQYTHLSPQMRKEIREILADTLDLPGV
ncbi:hypothetical protein K227x_40140 [Rubripirellula lacrimiformis]|uniref:Cytochrome c domain-containing protein n=1 Tax=Rubripirellula lacrimiformis TaxID=1930273 RepID=A0A517NEQ7_9BACT|nr:hypothetical protein [Rubripirellula lacrimiformis]QDT05613.1 hypothetical protein K227x_40140 [Rubripirellula lacrimiformis]